MTAEPVHLSGGTATCRSSFVHRRHSPYLRYTPYMEAMYTTVTSKGQITLPAAARRALGLHRGQRLGIRIEGSRLVIDPPPDLASLRSRLRAAAEEQGTWGHVGGDGEGWAGYVGDKYDGSGRAQS